MSRWLMLAALLISLAGGLIWSLMSIGEYRAEQDQYEQAIIHLNQTLLEQQARHEQTDRMLAETARQRADAVRRAGQLADELRDLGDPGACHNAGIDADIAERVRIFRTHPPVPEGTGATNLD
ncbi:hypothetical protein [Marinobacterium stanieri]|uniref:hypothetical protein n=1 Tax=Marinobacterium stanieri TaxID=49186 RepID=UPI00097077FF|nr:hypothetical protein [Marinobacterium stanieri]